MDLYGLLFLFSSLTPFLMAWIFKFLLRSSLSPFILYLPFHIGIPSRGKTFGCRAPFILHSCLARFLVSVNNMTRQKSGATASSNIDVNEKSLEIEKPSRSEEQVNLDDEEEEEQEHEEIMEEEEEEVEYEEVEEEVEEEEVEEEEDEEEEENAANESDEHKRGDSNREGDDEDKKRSELLSLPPHGSEVYLGGIPPGASEEDIKAFCESIGEVFEVRIMKGKDASDNKGYAFVTFRTKELAAKAVKYLTNTELKGRKVKCSTSQAKHRLFIGNVPKELGDAEMKKIVKDLGPGVTSVELIKDPHNRSRNRGYAFIEYYNQACAEYSRKKMSTTMFKLGNNAPTVSWADPRNAESSTANQVKALYVKNLPRDISQDRLQRLFENHGKITKVVVPPAKAGHENSRYGFVHFADRSSAMKALKNTEKYEIDGQVLECSLAKPQASEQKPTAVSNSQKSGLVPNYAPRVGFGFVGGAYGASPGFPQPMIYGGDPSPAGMAMIPMLLPDGRIGYVLQQPGLQPHHQLQHQPQPHRPGSSSRGRSTGNRPNSSSSHRGRGRGSSSRYSPY